MATTRGLNLFRNQRSAGLSGTWSTYMNRERALKAVLGLVGLIFLASVYPWVFFVRQEPSLSMMFSVYVTIGIFLLLAVRNPSANRNLIAFTACSSFAHAALMGVQTYRSIISRGELVGVALLVVIGVALITLASAKRPANFAAAFAPAWRLPLPSKRPVRSHRRVHEGLLIWMLPL